MSDTITVKVCSDAQCTKPVAGSPQSISVNYTVTGNAIPNALFALTVSSLVLEAPTSGTAATGTTTITTDGMPPYGAYVFPTIGSGAALVSATVKSDLDGSATLSLTAKPPASLGSGIYNDTVQLKICYDSACTKPATPTPLTVQGSVRRRCIARRRFHAGEHPGRSIRHGLERRRRSGSTRPPIRTPAEFRIPCS